MENNPDGSNPVQIYAELAEHPKWSPDGSTILFDADSGKSLKMIPAKGGKPVNAIPDSFQLKNGGMPSWSPDGSHFCFLEGTTASLCVAERKTNTVSRIYREEGMLPIPGCWSRDGNSILVALMDRKTRKCSMWKFSRAGKTKELITGPREGFYRHIALSPDGSLIIYASVEEKQLGLWIMRTEGGKSLPLAVTHPGHNEGAAWSPDGKTIVFTSTRGQNFDLWRMDLDIKQIMKELQE